MRLDIACWLSILFAVFMAILGLWWLAAGMLGITSLVFIISKWKSLRNRLQKHQVLSGFLLLFSVVLFAVLLRIFVFEIYSIPTGSMEESLVPEELITGKATIILWSGGLRNFRWKRVMMKIK